MKVYLDDQRPTPVGWTRAYWPDEVIRLLRSRKVKVLSLDHDLGDDQRGTGYDVITWIEQEVALGRFTPPLILVHSANPVAAQRMRAGIESISKLLDGMSLSQGSTLKAYEIDAHGRKVLMEDLELLSRLEGHQAFGVSMVQRISGFGYQRALDTIARLEAEGAILRDDASSQWMLDNTRARLHALYHTHKSTVRELEDFPRAGVEPLILMDVPKGWSKATNRVLIVGQETLATAWTDFTSTGDYRVAMSLCWEWMSDFTQIRIGEGFRKLRPVDLIARNICARDFLTTELAKDFGGKTVVVTHHCPIEEVAGDGHECSGQLIPDTVLSFSSAFAGASPSLN